MESGFDCAAKLRELQRHRKRVAMPNLIEPRVKKGGHSHIQCRAQIFDGSADDSSIIPKPTIYLFLTLEGHEASDELVDRFAGRLQRNGSGEFMIGRERVVGGHDGVENLVPVRVGASNAPLFSVIWENPFLAENGLDEKTKDAVNGIVLGGGEFVVPGTVDIVFRKRFPRWDENSVKQTVERESDVPGGPGFGGVLRRDVGSPAKIF